MKYARVYVDAFGYALAPVVVSSEELEERLAPVYGALHLRPGQLEALTGIHERRWWERDFAVGDGAIEAGAKALGAAGVSGEDVGVLVYAGVNREDFEPATACRVAAELGVRGEAGVYDISNACLGMLNGMIDVANRIELGQIRAGLIVSCETAREINDVMIERMNATPTMDLFTKSLATLTGGSGAAAVLLTDGSLGAAGRAPARGWRERRSPRTLRAVPVGPGAPERPGRSPADADGRAFRAQARRCAGRDDVARVSARSRLGRRRRGQSHLPPGRSREPRDDPEGDRRASRARFFDVPLSRQHGHRLAADHRGTGRRARVSRNAATASGCSVSAAGLNCLMLGVAW
jgi:hypothetical protein